MPVQNYSRKSNPFEYCLFGLLIQFIDLSEEEHEDVV